MARSSGSVFNHQKVKKRGARRRFWHKLSKGYLLTAVFLLTAIFSTYKLFPSLSRSYRATKSVRVEPRPPNQGELAQTKTQHLFKTIKVKVAPQSPRSSFDLPTYQRQVHALLHQAGSCDALEPLAKELQTKLVVEKVELACSNTDALIVRITPYQPVLVVEGTNTNSNANHRWFYVSASGQWYGNLSRAEAQLSTLPPLVGLKNIKKFAGKFPPDFGDQTNDVVISFLEITKEATHLAQTIKSVIAVGEVRFDPYLGFVVVASSPQLEINMGRSPFDKKITQLTRILEQLKNKGTRSAKIDLDHAGKAFVKEL